MASNSVIQYTFDYTDCSKATSTFQPVENQALGIVAWKYTNGVCSIQVSIKEDIPAPVYMYYRLTNFYQNNRKYVKSFDLNQLNGKNIIDPNGLTADCDPLRSNPTDTWVLIGTTNTTIPAGSAVIYPCGLIANSMFSGNFLE